MTTSEGPPEHWSRSRRTAHWALGSALAVGITALAYHSYSAIGAIGNHYDDAYITFRYAVQLARGNGLVFNVGDKADAASSTLYTMVLAIARLAHVDIERAATFIGLGSLAGVVLVVYVATYELARRRGIAVLAALAAGYHGFVSAWAVSGMETTAFTLGATLFVHVALLDGRRRMTAAALLAGLVWLRTESILLFVAWFIQAALAAGRGGLRAWARPFAVVGASVAAFAAFKLAYYGTLLPHALELKRLWLTYAPNADAVLKPWNEHALWIALLGIGALTRLPRPAALALGAWLSLSAISFIRGPYSDWVRYTTHVLPTLCILAGHTLALLTAELPLLALVLALLVAKQVDTSAAAARTFATSFSRNQPCRKQVGTYVREHVDPDELVLSSDLGAIAYEAPC
jgi:hypothetical protein